MNDQIFQIVLIILGFLGTIINAFAALAWWALRQEVKHVKELFTVEIVNMKDEINDIKERCGACTIEAISSLHGHVKK